MRWLRGAPDGRTCAEGGPRAAAGCAGCRPGLLPRAAPPPSRAPGPAPIWGGPTACGGPGSVVGGGRTGSRSRASPARICSRRVPRPASHVPHPASAGQLGRSLRSPQRPPRVKSQRRIGEECRSGFFSLIV